LGPGQLDQWTVCLPSHSGGELNWDGPAMSQAPLIIKPDSISNSLSERGWRHGLSATAKKKLGWWLKPVILADPGGRDPQNCSPGHLSRWLNRTACLSFQLQKKHIQDDPSPGLPGHKSNARSQK
jgi:hypothetical protein